MEYFAPCHQVDNIIRLSAIKLMQYVSSQQDRRGCFSSLWQQRNNVSECPHSVAATSRKREVERKKKVWEKLRKQERKWSSYFMLLSVAQWLWHRGWSMKKGQGVQGRRAMTREEWRHWAREERTGDTERKEKKLTCGPGKPCCPGGPGSPCGPCAKQRKRRGRN